MRIISQNGRIDLPYEQVAVAIDTTDTAMIIAYAASSDDGTIWNLAEYSTKEKAVKAMEMLITEYGKIHATRSGKDYFVLDYPKVFQFPPDRGV